METVGAGRWCYFPGGGPWWSLRGGDQAGPAKACLVAENRPDGESPAAYPLGPVPDGAPGRATLSGPRDHVRRGGGRDLLTPLPDGNAEAVETARNVGDRDDSVPADSSERAPAVSGADDALLQVDGGSSGHAAGGVAQPVGSVRGDMAAARHDAGGRHRRRLRCHRDSESHHGSNSSRDAE